MFSMFIKQEVLKKIWEEFPEGTTVEVDSYLKEAYKNSALMNDHMSGDFPILKPSANAINWTGNVTKVIIRPNWRFL